MSDRREETSWESTRRAYSEAKVKAIDAVMFFVHNVELDEFTERWLPDRAPEYVKEKWNLMHKALPRFWGTLDEINSVRFLDVAQQYYHDKRVAKVASKE